MGKIYKKKLLKTREELEIMKSALIDVFNLPITDQSKCMKYKDCRRNLKEIIEGVHKEPMNKNLYDSLVKWKLPEMEIKNKKAIITLMKEVQLTTSLINQNVGNEAVMETNEHMIVEELWYKMEETYVARTKIVLHTEVIRTTDAEEMMDHG